MTATLSHFYYTDNTSPNPSTNNTQALQNIPTAGPVFLLSSRILGGPDSDLYISQCAAMMLAWRNDKVCAHHACSEMQELGVVWPKCAEFLCRSEARSREEALWLCRGGENGEDTASTGDHRKIASVLAQPRQWVRVLLSLHPVKP